MSACIGASIEGGSIDGTDFSPRSAYHFEIDNILVVFISTHPDPCQRFLDSTARVSDLDSLTLRLSDIDFDGFSVDIDPPTAGTYDIRRDFGDFEGKGSQANFADVNESCDTEKSVSASDGFIELSTYDEAGGAGGNFELEMDGDDVRGSFNAAPCNIDEDEIERDNGDCDP